MSTEHTTILKPEVLVRLPEDYRLKLELIAQSEVRMTGPQARKLVMDGIDLYFEQNPKLAKQLRQQLANAG